MKTRYAIIQTASTDGVFNGPMVPTREGTTLYVRRIEVSRVRRGGMYGVLQVKLTQEPEKALTWATRETAQKHAETHTSDWRAFEVIEMPA